MLALGAITATARGSGIGHTQATSSSTITNFNHHDGGGGATTAANDGLTSAAFDRGGGVGFKILRS